MVAIDGRLGETADEVTDVVCGHVSSFNKQP